MKTPLNAYSRRITQPKSQGASQAMLYGVGLTEAEMSLAQVGIASVWYEGNPCNMHLLELAAHVKKGVQQADMVAMRFNTVGVSDAIAMGTDGMNYSLQSRELIADSIETAMSAHWYDACVVIPGCDKNMPGCLIALGRLNRPGLMIYGGTIASGCWDKKPIDIVSAFQSYGQSLSGAIDETQRQGIIRNACPGPGACGGMYTANTMACAIEALGMTLPYSSSLPAVDPAKADECRRVGAAIRHLLENDIKPRDIMTRDAFENAMTVVMAMGGSTNAVLHLIAMAKAADVPLGLDDFQAVSDRVPVLADFKPSGKYAMADLHGIGGTPAVLRLLLDNGLLRGDCLTVTGKSLAENLNSAPRLADGQSVVRPPANPLKATGHLQILRGTLAPEGAVAKITGKEGEHFAGPARVFDSEEEMVRAFERGQIGAGAVIVIRYEGPKGGPGMPEMLLPTSIVMGAGMGRQVALVTDGRFSGGSHGFIVGHVSPEAQEGGPIALVRDGDKISIDALGRSLTLHVDDAELTRRRAAWTMPAYKAVRGALRKYIKNVSSASLGCVTDE